MEKEANLSHIRTYRDSRSTDEPLHIGVRGTQVHARPPCKLWAYGPQWLLLPPPNLKANHPGTETHENVIFSMLFLAADILHLFSLLQKDIFPSVSHQQ